MTHVFFTKKAARKNAVKNLTSDLQKLKLTEIDRSHCLDLLDDTSNQAKNLTFAHTDIENLESSKTETFWPDSEEIRSKLSALFVPPRNFGCNWCRRQFEIGSRLCLPYANKNYCSFNCMATDNENIDEIHDFYRKLTNNQKTKILTAPCWTLLVENGGCLTSKQYDNCLQNYIFLDLHRFSI